MKFSFILIFALISIQSTLAARVYKVRAPELFSNSRPCCSLTQDPVSKAMGFTKATSHKELSRHIFKNNDLKKEGNGLVYACKAGYIDLTHLRDTADWTYEAFRLVRKHLGAGKFIQVKEEGGPRRLVFPKMDVSDLSKDDLLTISAMISYQNAVWHEIATGLNFVSFQHMSAFSPEDNYSNYLGTFLAKKALKNYRSFNFGMTKELKAFLIEQDNKASKEKVLNSLDSLKGVIWEYSGVMTDLIIRNPRAYDTVYSFKSPDKKELGCFNNDKLHTLQVEKVLSNGRLASDYFNLEVEVTPSMKKSINAAGSSRDPKVLTEEDHKWLTTLTIDFLNSKD
jgi:hypothetical protein